MSAQITSIKRAVMQRIKGLLGAEGHYVDTPATLRAEECVPFAVVISSDEPTQYREVVARVVTVEAPLTVDVYMGGRSVPQLDQLVEDLWRAVVADPSLGGLAQEIHLSHSMAKAFENNHALKVVMFDFVVTYQRELPEVPYV